MTAGGKGACVQLAACVGEQRHRAPFGLVGIQYFLGRGEGGGVPVDVEGEGKRKGPLPTFKPRPPTRIHRSSKQTTLTLTLSAQPLEPTLLLLPESCTFPIPPSASQSTGQPTQIRFSEVAVVVRQPSQPSHSRPSNHRRNPDKSDPNEPTSLAPNHYRSDSHLASLDVFPTPITYPSSWTPRTRRPCRLCSWVAAVLHRGTDLLDRDDPIHAQTRPKTHTPYQA